MTTTDTNDQDTRTEEELTEDGKRELVKTGRMYAAEAVYNGFSGYSKITSSLITERDLALIAKAIGAPVEVLQAMREKAGDVLPDWDSLPSEAQERFAHSEEMDELGFLVLQGIKYALNPAQREADEREEAEHQRRHHGDPLDKLIDMLANSKGDLTIIRGRLK